MQSDNLRGAGLMMGSMACFTLGDACIKATGGEIPLAQILLLRGALASVLVAALAWRLGALRWPGLAADRWRIAVRSIAEVCAAYFFLTALLNMPLANLTALLQMLPLTVTAAGALFMKEPVGWRRALAVAVGFMGMLLIVRPGATGFNAFTVYGLLAVACVTIRDLVTRRLSAQVPSLTVTLAASVAVTLFGAAWGAASGGDAHWVALAPGQVGLILAATGFVMGGYLFSVMVMRVGDLTFVAFFRYTGLLWALVLGALFFGEWPTGLTLTGAAIVVGSGAYTLWREGHAGRRSRALARRS